MVDCNNFYASCERAFDPTLRNRPVAILSNNDGCVIARSEEAKAIGIEMGTPEFKARRLIRRYNVAVLSSNYALYGDMSARVMDTLRSLTPDIELYSIDEAFLKLSTQVMEDLHRYGRIIRLRTYRWTGIPVSVGIAPTKTLAKIANRIAKKRWLDNTGCVDFVNRPGEQIDALLERVPTHKIWGIGKGLAARLERIGVTNACQFKYLPEQWVKDHLHLPGLRTVRELKGLPSIAMEDVSEPRKGILSSRSFGEPVYDIDQLREAVATFTTRAAEKLRGQGSVTGMVTVSLRTNKYIPGNSNYRYSISRNIPTPTDHTPTLIKAAHECLHRLYQIGKQYKKASVTFTAIIPKGEVQADLFRQDGNSETEQKLMQCMDHLNDKFGRRTTHFAATGIRQPWQMKQQYLSRKYTTDWDQLMVVG